MTPVPCQIDLSRLSGREIWCRSDDIIWWQYIRRSISTAAAGRKIARLLQHWFFADFQVAIWRIFQSGISALVCRYCRYSLGSRVGGGRQSLTHARPLVNKQGKEHSLFIAMSFSKVLSVWKKTPLEVPARFLKKVWRGAWRPAPRVNAQIPLPARSPAAAAVAIHFVGPGRIVRKINGVLPATRLPPRD